MKKTFQWGFIILFFLFMGVFLNQRVLPKEKSSPDQIKLVVQFGGMDVPEEQIFNNPNDLAVSQEGSLYILDSKDHNIKVFNRKGKFIHCIGRRGKGPGEFDRPWTLTILKGNLYITDTRNRRVQILSKKGKYLRSYKAPVEYGQGMAFDSEGNLYISTKGFRSSQLISVYNKEGKLITHMGNLEGNSVNVYNMKKIKNQIQKEKIPDIFKNDLLLVVYKKSHLFAVHRSLPKFKKFSLTGKLLAEYPIKAEEYKSIYQTFLEKNKKEKNPAAFWMLQYVNDLAVDEEGNLYFLLNEPSQMTIYVYDDKGHFKKKLTGVQDDIYRIALSEKGYLYALSQKTQSIYKFKLGN